MTEWRPGKVLRLHDRAILYFDAVRQYGSIREAARRLNVTPSALTRQLGQMEAEIGAPLFDRLPGGMVLTAAGDIIARHIVTVVQDARRTDERIAALQGGHEGHLGIMAVAGIMGGLLPRILQRMMTRHSGIVIHAEAGSPGMIARALSSGQTDVGIAFSMEPMTDLRQITVATFPVGAIVPEGHPLSRKTSVTVAECLKYPLILPSSTLSLRWVMEPFLRPYRDQLQIIMETGSIELTNRMVVRGAGISFQSWLALEPGNTGLVHIPLRDSGATTDLGVYVREARWLPPALEALIEEVRIALGETDGGAG
ncbi:LysR family transcriptional regulator [Acetobacter oeni]|uniref:Transcriptional regulator n=1 Tax=Acetobacter oeni TaxID=304077 RepID=A0A511XMX6_9PROT|nr:LysR family transcriptional regulator [Acetobacter oeni]MBB3881514.1 DNA-binding transcriptional LysR family regulator [Acetobacter oeni]NHO18377.1 LysR family transcriptional regulator [Acetobacter oeni]GBR10773.1 LysR family transcriptional regulator [Acetobacter oeni LMG 21952]GEN64300.1 transcriptional regulator [Acetobacter oeni]